VLRADLCSFSNSMMWALSCSISLFLAMSAGDNSGDIGCGVQLSLHVADEIVGGASGPHGSVSICVGYARQMGISAILAIT
jgi:hypothetical protein